MVGLLWQIIALARREHMKKKDEKIANSETESDEGTIREMIAQAAYLKAEKRGFALGGEDQD